MLVSTRSVNAVAVVTAALVLVLVFAAPAPASPPGALNPFCARLGHTIEASAGAQMYCFGSPGRLGAGVRRSTAARTPTSGFSANVDAASLSEDVSPSGVRGYGQSETSIAAMPPYVVEGWNDSTAFFSACPSPMNKQEGTGIGFSANSGASFTDIGGAPNAACATHLTQGDPSIEAWKAGGSTYFYISSLYPSVNPALPVNDISLTACKASGTGSSARLSCGQPLVAAASTQCATLPDSPTFCSFLDKDFLSIDPSRGRLYVSYTEFGSEPSTFNGQVELAVCDLGLPSGAPGPAGGTPGHPICKHGTQASPSGHAGSPYLKIAPGDPNCESEGSYPAADTASGDAYVAYEFNAATNLFAPPCFGTPTKNVLTRVPASCLKLATVSPCSGPAQTSAQPITSMDSAFIPGYNRFPMNDFPRIAVTPAASTVSMVWNDAGSNPLGDILLRSYSLGTLAPVQAAPVRLDSGTSGFHFLPALRNASAAGKIAVSWFDRATPGTTLTDLRADLSLNPRLASPPAPSALVTSQSTDWNAVSSDITPNFGDYTDNYAAGGRLFLTWSDGRLGLPQPFAASAAMP